MRSPNCSLSRLVRSLSQGVAAIGGGGFGGACPPPAVGGFAGAAGLAATGFSPAGLAGSGWPAAGSAPSGFGSSAIQYPCETTTINTGGWESQIIMAYGPALSLPHRPTGRWR